MDSVLNRRVLIYFFFIFLVLFVYYIYVDFSSYFELKNYALYLEEDNSLVFVNSRLSLNKGDRYDGMVISDVFSEIEGLVTLDSSSVPWNNYSSVIEKVYVKDFVQPINTSYWFYNFENCYYLDLEKLDMSYVTDMSYMFYNTGSSVSNFKIDGLTSWDTSNAIIMKYMFYNTGRDSISIELGNLEKWDTADVYDMSYMFAYSGVSSDNFNIGDISKWDTSYVTDMSYMFKKTGYNSNWKINLSNWDVDKVDLYEGFNRYIKNKVIEPDWND